MEPEREVLVAVPDLLFGVQIANAVRGAGGTPRTMRRGADARAALGGPEGPRPAAVVVDLAAPLDTGALIRAAAEAGVPVFAFGPHLDGAAIQAARAAGATRVVANSALARALPDWLAARLGTAGLAPEP